MKKVSKIVLISLIVMFGITIKSYAGSFGISVNPGTAEPNSTVTISITGTNATGRINVTGNNIKLSSGSVWVENNTQTITGTITGGDGQVATITATATDLADSTTADDIKGSKPASVSIKKKEQPVQTQTTQPAQQTQQAQQTKTQTTVTKVEPAKQTQTKAQVQNQNKAEVPKENNLEDQGTKAEFGLSALYLFGVKENEEKVELKFSPDFNINTAEYTCSVGDDIKKLQIDYDANEYKDLVKVEGIDQELNPGDNVININMKNTDGTEKAYKITVNKQVENTVAESNNEPKAEDNQNNNDKSNTSKKEEKYIKMPIPGFIGLQVGIIVIEILLFGIAYMAMTKKYNAKAKRYNKETSKINIANQDSINHYDVNQDNIKQDNANQEDIK